MPSKKASVFTHGKKLSDGEMYIINIIDLSPAGMLIKAYSQTSTSEYTLSPSELELSTAGLNRSSESLLVLADSVDVVTGSNGNTFISSNIEAIRDQKIVPQGPAVKVFMDTTPAGSEGLPALLTTGLSEMCKVKPEGVDAVRWLGEWLLENNPNQPNIDESE